MRELELNEMEVIAGGNPLLIAGAVAGAVVVVGGLAVLAYGISKGCSGSVKVGPEGAEVTVTCPAGP